MKLICPSCQHEFSGSIVAFVDEKQRMSLVIKKAEGSEWLSADTVGGVITATDKLLKAVARDLGGNVTVFISGVEYKEHDSEVKIDFVIVNSWRSKAAKKKKETPK